jgi:hypothetical protein
MRALALLALLLGPVAPAAGQDTIRIINPDAPPVQLRSLRGPPPDVVAEAIRRYNDTTVSRFYGSHTVASGTWIRGDLAVYRGTLRVVGRVTGRVTVINGTLIIGPLGTVEGDVVVLGGRMEIDSTGRHAGSLRTYAEPAPVFRSAAGTLQVLERPLRLGDLAAARTTFQAGRLKTTLSLETGRNYNRVEGLPILVGPTLTYPTANQGEARIEAWGLFRTEKDDTDRLSQFGWQVRAEYEGRGEVRGGLGFRWQSVVEPIEGVQLARNELGWSSFLLRRDYDDYYQSRGVEGFAYLDVVPWLRVRGAARYDDERTVPASDPVTLLRADSPWRVNPLIDDGHYTTFRGEITLDTRNSPITPTSGWWLQASIERSLSEDVAPVALPSEVRDPIPTFRRYAFNRIWFDGRGYARVNQATRANLRVLGGGWLGGDPLPVQRRLSLGGPGLLPGLPFRTQRCAPPAFSDAAGSALCDRLLVVQGEIRHRFPLRLRELLGADEFVLLDRLFGGDQADFVVFGDAGKAWLSGDGPGRVRSDRIPQLKEWDYDAGVGLDLGGLALYVAKSLSTSERPRITVRLQRRF